MRKKRLSPTVNAGSMADIAFLLLIFFLVSTQILNDKGVKVLLPDYTENQAKPSPQPNIFSIWINSANELLVEKEEMDIAMLRPTVKKYIMNPTSKLGKIRSPKKAIITINSDQNTSYEMYVQVYTELKNAYREIWDSKAQSNYGKPLLKLTKDEFKIIKTEYPLRISEVEKYN